MKRKIIPTLLILFLQIILTCFSFNQNVYSKELELYTGDIQVLSFNTLMAFPEKALNENNSLSAKYDEEKLTTSEFERILEELYKNNYILVDIYEIIDKEKIELKKLYLPKDKKPIVFTFENVTYKSNYQNLGEIDKIIIDRNNNLASYTTKKSIQNRIQYNNEFILIMENFINKHKDFSFNNARGIMFLAGENGVLGYNTSHKNASSKQEQKRASEVIKKLKKLGWRFGANNYSYKDISSQSEMEFAKDLSLWNQEILPLISSTNLYSFICEKYENLDHEKMEILLSNNFKIFFINDNKNTPIISKNICIFPVKKIGGKNLREDFENLSNLFDSKKVYDKKFRQEKLDS